MTNGVQRRRNVKAKLLCFSEYLVGYFAKVIISVNIHAVNFFTLRLLHHVCSKIWKVESFLQHILCRYVDMFCFVNGLGCHYSPLHFKLQTQITLASIQVLQQHFQCHNQYDSSLTLSVCKHTATLCTVTSLLLLLGVLQYCDQQCSRRASPHSLSNQNTRNLSEP